MDLPDWIEQPVEFESLSLPGHPCVLSGTTVHVCACVLEPLFIPLANLYISLALFCHGSLEERIPNLPTFHLMGLETSSLRDRFNRLSRESLIRSINPPGVFEYIKSTKHCGYDHYTRTKLRGKWIDYRRDCKINEIPGKLRPVRGPLSRWSIEVNHWDNKINIFLFIKPLVLSPTDQ